MSVKIQRQLRQGLADLYTFVRSQEANRAVQAVTFTQLLAEQLRRNGETSRLGKAVNNPYSFDPTKTEPATKTPLSRGNFLSGSDTGNLTKLDRVVYLKNAMEDLVNTALNLDQEDIVSGDATDSPEAGDLTTDDPFYVGSGEGVGEDLA